MWEDVNWRTKNFLIVRRQPLAITYIMHRGRTALIYLGQSFVHPPVMDEAPGIIAKVQCENREHLRLAVFPASSATPPDVSEQAFERKRCQTS